MGMNMGRITGTGTGVKITTTIRRKILDIIVLKPIAVGSDASEDISEERHRNSPGLRTQDRRLIVFTLHVAASDGEAPKEDVLAQDRVHQRTWGARLTEACIPNKRRDTRVAVKSSPQRWTMKATRLAPMHVVCMQSVARFPVFTTDNLQATAVCLQAIEPMNEVWINGVNAGGGDEVGLGSDWGGQDDLKNPMGALADRNTSGLGPSDVIDKVGRYRTYRLSCE
jgi:hypothetical protein